MTDTLKMAREALQAMIGSSEFKTLQGDADWHVRAMPSKAALNAARAAIAAIDAQAPQAAPVGWLRAIDEALVTSHLDVANADDTYEVAKEKLNRLLAHEQGIGAYFATPPKQAAPVALTEPITVEAVAAVRLNKHGHPYLDWLVEGGIYALPAGCVLVMPSEQITNDDGSGEVYRAGAAAQGGEHVE